MGTVTRKSKVNKRKFVTQISVCTSSVDRSLVIKGFLSLPGMEREITLQVEISFVNVHFSCKRVTSPLFSELLLCL